MLPFATAGIQLHLLDSLLAESGGRFSGDGLKMSEIRQNHWALAVWNMERWSPVASQDQFAIVSRVFLFRLFKIKGIFNDFDIRGAVDVA
jgi:hypothetical protein